MGSAGTDGCVIIEWDGTTENISAANRTRQRQRLRF
jgi:hypothetical protein